jgi:hypothetical protein
LVITSPERSPRLHRPVPARACFVMAPSSRRSLVSSLVQQRARRRSGSR